MSARVDKFCEDLRERLNAVEARAETVKASIQSLPGKTEKAVQDNVKDVRARLRAQKERIDKCRADLTTWGAQKEAETESVIREWKAKREAKKLTARADRAEAYAEAAVSVALATIEEAEEAMLDAALARMDSRNQPRNEAQSVVGRTEDVQNERRRLVPAAPFMSTKGTT